MFSFIFWVAFGATIGWAAAIIRDEKELRVAALYVVVGALGGLIGGLVGGMLDPTTAGYSTTTTDIIFAVFGATASVLGIGFISQKRSRQHN